MNPSEEFLRYAADCERMAKFTRDPESKATWIRMAARWLDCAERFERQSSATQRKGHPRRHPWTATDSAIL